MNNRGLFSIVPSTREGFSLLLVVILLFASLLAGIYFHIFGYIPEFLLKESGFYETSGATACLLAGLINLRSFKISLEKESGWGSYNLLLLSVTCIFIAGEEISWGQHFFNYDLPSYITANNFQGELNLHNSRLIQPSNNSLSRLFFRSLMFYFIAVPMLLAVFPTLGKFTSRMKIPIPSMCIAVISLFAKSGDIINRKLVYGSSVGPDYLHLGEAMESIFEICLLILAFEIFYGLKSRENDAIRTQRR